MRIEKLRKITGSIFGFFVLIVFPIILLPEKTLTYISISCVIAILLFALVSQIWKVEFLKLLRLLLIYIIIYSISLRAWCYLFDSPLMVIVLLTTIVILTGILPVAFPKLSKKIYLESFAPKTKVGKIVNKAILIFGVIFMAVAPAYGLHLKTDVTENSLFLWLIAIVMYICTIGFEFFTLYHYFIDSRKKNS